MNTLKQMHQPIVLLISMSIVFFVALHSVQAQKTANGLKKISMIGLKPLKRTHGFYLEDSLQDERKVLLKKKLSIGNVSVKPTLVSMPVIYDARGKALLRSMKKNSPSTASIKTEKKDSSFLIDTKQYQSVKNRAVSTSVKKTNIVKKIALRSVQEAVSKSVTIGAGGLYDALTSSERESLRSLTVIGTMDARDFKTMRDNMSNLRDIDLSGATIAAYTGTGGTDTVGIVKSYEENAIPQYAFWDPTTHLVHSLVSIKLPQALTKIGDFAFLGNASLTFLTIPSSVTCIGDWAFQHCYGLTSIDIPSSVRKIGTRAFSFCDGLLSATIAADTIGTDAFYWCDSLKSVKVTNDVALIGNGAFECNPLLESANVAAKTIGQWAFKDCYNLKNLYLTTDVTTIMSVAFIRCYSLSSVYIPSTVKTIGNCAFGACKGPFVVNVDNSVYASENGLLYNKDQSTLLQCPYHLNKYTIPSTVKCIELCAFYGCDSLTSLIIPSTVDSIRRGAFYYCQNLDSIVFSPSLKYIGEGAFVECDSIQHVVVPDGMNMISSGLFKDCGNLHSITIPSSIDSIGFSAFKNCNTLDTIYCHRVNPPVFRMIKNEKDIYNCFTNSKTVDDYENYAKGQDYNPYEGYLYELVFDMFDPEEDHSYDVFCPFYGVDTTICTVLVPQESLEAYRSADQWKSFSHIVALKAFCLPDSVEAFTAAGGSVSIPITTNTTWTVETTDPWLSVFPSSGNGNDTVTVEVTANKSNLSRSGLLIFTADGAGTRTLSIEQRSNKIQLTMTIPTVKKTKTYDGTTMAEITEPGVLSGVKTVDEGKVNVIQTASYDNAEIGTDKTITVVFTLSGPSSDKYLAPPNYQIGGAEIVEVVSDKKPALDSIILDSSNCGGSVLDIPYTVKSGTPVQYRIDFDVSANIAGLNDISYTDLSSLVSGMITVPTPDSMAYGTYTGILQVRDNNGNESSEYPFQFLVQLSQSYIVDKFDDIVLFDNSSGQYCGYQWYKDGTVIDGATLQYYVDPEGLMGTYFVKVTTVGGKEEFTCSKVLNIPLVVEKSVTVYPNPVARNQPVTIRLSGIEEEEMKDAVLSVCDLGGVPIYRSTNLSTENRFVFSESDGAYIGHLVTKLGRNIVFVIILK